jgi:hypothetical protein
MDGITGSLVLFSVGVIAIVIFVRRAIKENE